jgi:hypothetical protein
MHLLKPIVVIALLLLFLQDVLAQKGVEDKRNAFNNRKFYARTTRIHDNFFVLQVAQLPQSLRVSYERRLNQQYIIGTHLSYRYARLGSGTMKAEFYGKYFSNQRAPQGLYFYGETGLAAIRNYTLVKLLGEITPGITPPASGDYGSFRKSVNFLSYFLGAGFGFQNAFGEDRRTLIDFALGYRWYKLPDYLQKTETNPENGLPYQKISGDGSPLSPLSPFSFRLGVGYLF